MAAANTTGPHNQNLDRIGTSTGHSKGGYYAVTLRSRSRFLSTDYADYADEERTLKGRRRAAAEGGV
jgi:hypothetical protein